MFVTPRLLQTISLSMITSNPLATEPPLMKVEDDGSNCLATEVALATDEDLPKRSAASLSSWTLRYFCETWSVLLRKLEIEFPIVSAGILIEGFLNYLLMIALSPFLWGYLDKLSLPEKRIHQN